MCGLDQDKHDITYNFNYIEFTKFIFPIIIQLQRIDQRSDSKQKQFDSTTCNAIHVCVFQFLDLDLESVRKNLGAKLLLL